jgi:hypothetical protein
VLLCRMPGGMGMGLVVVRVEQVGRFVECLIVNVLRWALWQPLLQRYCFQVG